MKLKDKNTGKFIGVATISGILTFAIACGLWYMVSGEKWLDFWGIPVTIISFWQRYIKGISYKTLSLSLKELEHDGLILRKEYPQIPPKVEYRLSERGKSLMPILDGMCDWGNKNRL